VNWPNPIGKYIDDEVAGDQGIANPIKVRDDTQNPFPGSPGPVMYYPQAEGAFKNELGFENTIDYLELKAMQDAYNSKVAAYNSARAVYEIAAAEYNSQVTVELTRRLSVSTLASPVTQIPQRPCGPNPTPAAYDGLLLKTDLTSEIFSTWTDEQKTAGWSTYAENNGNQVAASSFKEGFL
jgi:hypothetical protein